MLDCSREEIVTRDDITNKAINLQYSSVYLLQFLSNKPPSASISKLAIRYQFQRKTPQRGSVKFAIFSWNRCWSRKRYEICLWLLWNINWKSQVADRSVSVPLTLSDLERRTVSIQWLYWYPLTYEEQNPQGKTSGKGRIYRDQPLPNQTGCGASVFSNFGIPLPRPDRQKT